ncbi:hypothetical protein GCM10029992_14400 [Glycomyces albus]
MGSGRESGTLPVGSGYNGPMSRNSAPQFRRMPGSAILIMVFLGFVAMLHFAGGNALMELNAPAGVLVLLFGFVNMALAIGIGGRKRWAASGTPVWCGLMIILLVIVSIEQGARTRHRSAG